MGDESRLNSGVALDGVVLHEPALQNAVGLLEEVVSLDDEGT